MSASTKSPGSDGEQNPQGVDPSTPQEGAQRSASEGCAGSPGDRVRKELYRLNPEKWVRPSPPVLFGSGDISWGGKGKHSKPDPPPSTPRNPYRADRLPDPRHSRVELPKPPTPKSEVRGTGTRAESVASTVASLRGAERGRVAADARGRGCSVIFALFGGGLLTWLLLSTSAAVPGIALTFSALFLAYACKYYASIGRVLRWSNGASNGNGTNGLGHGELTSEIRRNPSMRPFISIHLPVYNEPAVIDRLLQACTSLDYPYYEVIVADDSTDETTQIIASRWASHPKVKVSRRENRSGFKGGALNLALKHMDPRTEFIVVFDADFIPPPDILYQFLAYFYGSNGAAAGAGGGSGLVDDRLAAVQGYQWHVLNASENWITRGIRAEYSGSYVIERSGQELGESLKMIAGSVFMIRADVLKQHGWGMSITEDWELTLKLYLDGYKVLYSPFVQAPAECVADFHQLAKQRMRWAEGHTYNVKKYFFRVLTSAKMSLSEKLEFLFYAPYYLQSLFFLVGTGSWLASELILKSHLPFWSETLGWTLVLTNTAALVLMNLTGLFIERGLRQGWSGLLSFVLLSFMLAPYQAYAALKGLMEPIEGGWHRTQKTGMITEMIERLDFGRRLKRLLPKKSHRRAEAGKRFGFHASRLVQRLPRSTKRILGRVNLPQVLVTVIVIVVIILGFFMRFIPVAFAAPDLFYLHAAATSGISPAGEYMNNTIGSGSSSRVFDAVGNAYWYSDETWPPGEDAGSIAAGSYAMDMYFDQVPSASHAQWFTSRKRTNETNTSTTVWSTYHTMDIVPAESSEDWIVIWTFNVGTTEDEGTDVRATVNDTTKHRGRVSHWNSDDQIKNYRGFVLLENISSTQTIDLDYKMNNAGTATAYFASIVAYRLDIDDSDVQWAWNETDAAQTIGADPASPTTIASVTINPASEGSYLIIGTFTGSGITNPDTILYRIQQDSSNFDPNAGYYRSQESYNTSVSDFDMHMLFRVANLTTGSRTFTLKASCDTGQSCNNVRYSRLAVIRLSDVYTFQYEETLGDLTKNDNTLADLESITFTAVNDEYAFWGQTRVDMGDKDSITRIRMPDSNEANDHEVRGATDDTDMFVHGFSDYATLSAGSQTIELQGAVVADGGDDPIFDNRRVLILRKVPDAPAGSVDITVGVYDTKPDGTEEHLITSASTTITSSTVDFQFPLGNGEELPLLYSNPRRLMLRIEVTGVSGGGSFTLAYDSAANPTYLNTPIMTVSDASLVLLGVVALIPMLTGLVMKKRRMAMRLAMVAISLIAVVALLGAQISTVRAAPDDFYLHANPTSGITPAGEYTNTTIGSGNNIKVFDTAGQNAYWYVDQTWPTGNDDGGIAAGTYTLNMYFKDIVTKGTCTLAGASTSVNCTIVPALADITKTFMIFQATSSNNEPQNTSVRCYITSTTNITCDRYASTGTVNIAWQAVEFPTGVTVQHLTPVCNVDGDAIEDITDVTISAVADMAKTFVLYSHATSGTTHDWNDPRTVRLTSTTNVEIRQAPIPCAAGSAGALQVVQYTNASVTRGETGAMTGTSLPVTGLSSVNTAKTMLLYSYRFDGGGAAMCDRMVRGQIDSATSLMFTRGDGGAGCDTQQILAIAWERIEFTEATTVQQVEPSMSAGTGSVPVGISSVDTRRTLVLAGGQHTAGQSHAEGSYSGDDVIGAMLGRHVLTSSTSLQVTRDDTNGSARWTSYVVQFPQPSGSDDIVVTVSHTASDGSGATTIVQSSTTTIDANTANPFALTIGSGALQTFTSADPRRLRVQINVAAVTGGGRFTLAYNSAANPGYLSTPVITVPEASLLLIMVAIFIPVMLNKIERRRRGWAGEKMQKTHGRGAGSVFEAGLIGEQE